MNIYSGLSEEQRVLAVEDEYVEAEISRDEDTLRRILHDRFVFNSNSGTNSGKAELIKSILGWKTTGADYGWRHCQRSELGCLTHFCKAWLQPVWQRATGKVRCRTVS